MKRGYLLIVLAMLVFSITGAAVANAQNASIEIPLSAQNDSGENGTAVLTDLGNGKTRVEVNVTGAPAGVPQPLHIHEGTCANLVARPTYPLTSAVDGKSVTEIDATLASLQNGNFAINGHKSAEEASVYVFCGDIPALAGTLPATGGDFSNVMWLTALFGAVLLVAGFAVLRRSPRVQ